MAEIRELKDKNGNIIYPITHLNAVFDSQGKNVLKDLDDLDNKQNKNDDALKTADKTIVGAINELFQSANNGKQLIANAIGTPLSANDTFSAMSEKINILKSNINPENIMEGVEIFGVTGTLKKSALPGWYIPANLWIKGSNMPQSLALINATAIGDNIHIVGGAKVESSYLQRKNVHYCYNTTNNSWVTKTSLPSTVIDGGFSTVNGKAYFIGGTDSSGYAVKTNYCYDPITDSWSNKAEMPAVRKSGGTAMVNNKIYWIEGLDSSNYSRASNYCYDPSNNTWSELQYPNNRRSNFGIASIGNCIYVIGGGNTSYNECYDTTTNTWTTKTAGSSYSETQAVALNNKVYVMGGTRLVSGSYPCLSEVNCYDPATDKWTSVFAMPNLKNNHALCEANNIAYSFGGQNGDYNYYNSTDIYIP